MWILRKLDEHLEEFFLVIFSVILVAVIALQVFMRHVLDSSLTWSEELARYCFIWLVYMGVSYGVKKQRHIKVDFLLSILKGRAKIALNIFANLLFLGFAITIIYYGSQITQNLFNFGQTSPALKLPMGLVYLATPIGMGLTSFRIIQQLISQFRSLFGEGDFEVKTELDLILEDAEESKEDK